MSGDFIDSNVFIYMFDGVDHRKRGIAVGLINNAQENRSGRISFQVVQETLNVITRRIDNPATISDARRFLDFVLAPLWVVMPSASIYGGALDIQARYRYSFYDSLIIASALDSGSSRLITEDLQDGQRIEGLTITNPFAA
jgi:predicted nucleic acid-binding protein